MQSPGWDLTFILLKEGMTGYHSKRKAEREAEFSLPSVGNNSVGSYSCAYFENRNPKRKSQASKTLDLVVTGFFPSPPSQSTITMRLPAQTLPDSPAQLQRCSRRERDISLSSESLWHQIHSVQARRGCWDSRFHPGQG
ncbi:immunoglobulin superfamily member 1-like [Sarcophilus harrisii]|uniref:immunoglobulin superfamily member 1-like n=1 Tax=Sarcophilus harrisii TaxID=9305 RepID=UPI001301D34B|nr:immunoglobulin superfamily member 1-like [Sarcophilus harrisii]